MAELRMQYLTDDERAALQARASLRLRRAEALVNPASGLANDYLNIFNEIVMLIEQLPMMPELFEDIQRWRPVSYQDYFRKSILPGRLSALEAYDRLDARFRRDFEAVVDELDRRSTGAVAAVRKAFKTETHPDALSAICERAGITIRETLVQATMIVNHGEILPEDNIQNRTDTILTKMSQKLNAISF